MTTEREGSGIAGRREAGALLWWEGDSALDPREESDPHL